MRTREILKIGTRTRKFEKLGDVDGRGLAESRVPDNSVRMCVFVSFKKSEGFYFTVPVVSTLAAKKNRKILAVNFQNFLKDRNVKAPDSVIKNGAFLTLKLIFFS